MKDLCDWFDQYRDGELTPKRRELFESHLSSCPECRMKALLLQNVVAALRSEAAPPFPLSARQIAARAIQKRFESWDVQLLSWLKPAPAWAAVAVLLLFVLSFAMWPGSQQTGTTTDYEVLMVDAASADQTQAPSSTWSDDQLERWLEQGGGLQ